MRKTATFGTRTHTPICVIVDECPCNLCSSLRVKDVDEDEDDGVAQPVVLLLSDVGALTCPDDDDDDDDDCE